LKTLVSQIKDIYCVVGHPQRTAKGLLNSASIIHQGKILATSSKRHLPNYGVFDERRYFIPGETTCVVNIQDTPVSVLICEDLWFANPALDAAQHGAKLILSPNASPFEIDKHEKRLESLSKRAKASGIPIFYTNQVGGQDDLVFDGGSMVVNHQGELCQLASFFTEDLFAVDVTLQDPLQIPKKEIVIPSEDERVYSALVLGVKDYLHKNHFKKALMGLSGGIDSALALCVAADAIGPENVHAVMMPSRYTAEISKEDAGA
jgi:NAD+ synthase (glutamine-hydrolysing)